MMKQLKTPLRYPGGKSRACSKLDLYLPDLRDFKEFREPFLGGGSVSIHITKKYPDLNIWVNDLYEPLINFWKTLQDQGEELQEQLLKMKSGHDNPTKAKYLFLQSKEYLSEDPKKCDNLNRAVSFYVVNKCSFSGLTEASSFSPQASMNNFTVRGIEKLTGYQELIKNWRITNLPYQHLLTDDKAVFTYLDPPYDIKDNLYGRKGSMHKGFDHDTFAVDCDCFVGPQLISYNSSQLVKERFKDYEVSEFDLTYTMRSVGEYMREQQDRKELVLTNYAMVLANEM